MTVTEYMQKYSLTYNQVYNRIRAGLIPAEKNGKEYDLEDVAPPPVEDARGGHMPQSRRLKDELTAMQIKKIQQQLEEGKRIIRAEYRDELLADIKQIFSPLKNALLKLKLSKEQLQELTECIEKAAKTIETFKGPSNA